MMLTDLICAPLDRAPEIVRDYPRVRNWPVLEMKGIDNAALAALALVWNDEQLSEELEAGDVLASIDQNGPWVLAVPDRLRDLIASMRAEDIPGFAGSWVNQGDMKYVGWEVDDAEAALTALQRFANTATSSHLPLMLWMSL